MHLVIASFNVPSLFIVRALSEDRFRKALTRFIELVTLLSLRIALNNSSLIELSLNKAPLENTKEYVELWKTHEHPENGYLSFFISKEEVLHVFQETFLKVSFEDLYL